MPTPILVAPGGIIELMFDSLRTAIDELAASDPEALDNAELHRLVVDLHRQSARLAAVCTRAVGAWDARKVWADNGSKSPAARLARETRCAPSHRACHGAPGPAAALHAPHLCGLRGR